MRTSFAQHQQQQQRQQRQLCKENAGTSRPRPPDVSLTPLDLFKISLGCSAVRMRPNDARGGVCVCVPGLRASERRRFGVEMRNLV